METYEKGAHAKPQRNRPKEPPRPAGLPHERFDGLVAGIIDFNGDGGRRRCGYETAAPFVGFDDIQVMRDDDILAVVTDFDESITPP